MEYHIHSRDYLVRARKRLDEGTFESLFYAAFELRCGIEARLFQYMDAQKDVSNKKKKGWKILKLARDIESIFRTGDKIAEITVREPSTGTLRSRFYYTPVRTNLQNMTKKIDDFRHAMKEYRAPNDPWWNEMREFLESVCSELEVANMGNLLGVPLYDPITKSAHFELEVPEGQDVDEQVKLVGSIGERLEVKVRYLDELPVELGKSS